MGTPSEAGLLSSFQSIRTQPSDPDAIRGSEQLPVSLLASSDATRTATNFVSVLFRDAKVCSIIFGAEISILRALAPLDTRELNGNDLSTEA